MYESSDMIGWKSDHSERPAVLYWMREHMSARMARSRMSGVASSESSHLVGVRLGIGLGLGLGLRVQG